jgi:CubicO group peptidase (beta-lactamase class C family)
MTTTSAAPTQELEPDAQLEAFLAEECARLAVPGASVGVIQGDRAIAASFGVTDVDHPLPVDADTLFMIGSTTKTFTATVLMALVSDGVVALDDPLVKHLPELELEDAAARDVVTVGQLYDHTAGWRGDVEVDTGWGDDALARALPEYVAKVPQVFAPGAMTSYNNLSLIIAGRLIEKLTGRSYEAAVKERLLEPLGMTDTFLLPWEVITRNVATGHVVRDGTATPAYVWPTSRAIGPAGGATSTVRDQLRYARFHLDGTATNRAPLDDEHRLAMQEPRVTVPSAISGVGVSWLLKDRDGLRMVSHGGNCSNLYVSSFDLAPDEGFAVTVLTNSRGGSALGGSIAEWAVQHYLGRAPAASRAPLPLAADLAAEYIGRYDAGQWDLVVTNDDGKLFVQMKLTDIAPDTSEDVLEAFRTPPAEVVLVAPDVIAPAGSPSSSSGDFIRDDDGRVAWLRQGLRVARRKA